MAGDAAICSALRVTDTPALPPRTDPPTSGDEFDVLSGFVDYLRDTVLLKAAGLDAAGLATALPPSTMTLGGLLKHLAYVEDYWVGYLLLGRDPVEPWRSAPWDTDADWDWHSAADDSPEQLRALWQQAVDTSRRDLPRDPAVLGVRERGGERVQVRYVLAHLVEEYGRHAGHADLIRESIDGTTGE